MVCSPNDPKTKLLFSQLDSSYKNPPWPPWHLQPDTTQEDQHLCWPTNFRFLSGLSQSIICVKITRSYFGFLLWGVVPVTVLATGTYTGWWWLIFLGILLSQSSEVFTRVFSSIPMNAYGDTWYSVLTSSLAWTCWQWYCSRATTARSSGSSSEFSKFHLRSLRPDSFTH